jgi:hypothetical protein
MNGDDQDIRDDIREIKEDVKAIRTILHGDGDGGLVTRQFLVEGRVTRLENCKRGAVKRTWAIVMLVIAAGLAVIVKYWHKL